LAATGATDGNWIELKRFAYIVASIAPKFGVSAEVIDERLRTEEVADEPMLFQIGINDR
jgi:hypothetical protein